MVSVTVLLATYNGLPYLREQLQSLKAQTVPFRMLVQDDGSTDDTQKVLHAFAETQPDVVFGESQGNHLGPAANFLSLIRQASGPVALCDQDDLWHAGKLENCLTALNRAEAQYGSSTPILVHSDLQVISEAGQVLHESFFAHQKWDPNAASLPRLLVQNNVTGCALMINEALRALVAEHAKPEHVFMHDWFLAQTAAAFGKIVFVPQPLVSYRQHGDNAIGASRTGIPGRLLRALAMPKAAKKRIQVNYTEAQSLLDSYGDSLPAEAQAILQAFLAIPRAWKPRRPFLLKKGGYLMQNRTLRIGQYILT